MNRYQFVPEHNGIEIYFQEKPDESVREEMKCNGWRWHSAKGCWYNKKSPSNEEFAKKICTPLTKPIEKKAQSLQPPIVAMHPSCVTIQQRAGNVLVGTLTVYRSEQGYSLASTNNQIICCDCHMFFSIHARACPFCGCPINYAAEYYYNTYDPGLIQQQQIRQEMQWQEEQKRQEEEEREEIIQELGSQSSVIRHQLRSKNTQTLRIARERANRLSKLNAPIHQSDDTFLELLCGGERQFERAFHRASQIKAMESVLPQIWDEEWQHICSLNDSAFNKRVQELVMKKRKMCEEKEAYANKKREQKQAQDEQHLKELCVRYRIDPKYLESLITRYGSKEVLLRKLQLVDTIGWEYRNRINVLNHLDSPDSLQKVVNALRKQP